MKKLVIYLLIFCLSKNNYAQNLKAKSFKFSSKYAMFPDSLRNVQPRIYNGITYNLKEHYSDSSVFIYIPNYFNKNIPFQFVYWFHGWNNNIDTALVQFNLLEQFDAAKKNAIFIFPEGPKNSPDSYGGKLEKEGVFENLQNEIIQKLVYQKVLKNKLNPSIITLSGHSGAYMVIAKIIEHNNKLPILQVLLFDALYGEIETYFKFIKNKNKFIDIYTDSAGTMQNSIDLMKELKTSNTNYVNIEEIEITNKLFLENKIVFIHSKNSHNDVIFKNNNFKIFLSLQ